jgi:hypothetical protein
MSVLTALRIKNRSRYIAKDTGKGITIEIAIPIPM